MAQRHVITDEPYNEIYFCTITIDFIFTIGLLASLTKLELYNRRVPIRFDKTLGGKMVDKEDMPRYSSVV